jgi:hypothetical protein
MLKTSAVRPLRIWDCSTMWDIGKGPLPSPVPGA